MSLIRDKLFSTVALSHFAVDVLNGQRSVLFVYIAATLGLSNTQLGILSTAYVLVAAVMQPFFGYLADKRGSRWAIAGGTLWIGLFFSIGLLAPSYAGMALFVVASLGSGAFHPAGTMQATLVGRDRFASRETTASSLFFLFGQAGMFVGPLLGGILLSQSGMPGLLWLSVFAVLIGLIGFVRLSGKSTELVEPVEEKVESSNGPSSRFLWLAFAILATSGAWVQQNMIIFVPKYLSDLGQSSEVYGVLSSLYIGAGALGLMIGGILADRFGKRRVAASMLALAVLPLAAIPLLGLSPLLYVAIPLAGLFSGSTHSIVVVLAQRYIPGGMAMTSGLILGFIFSMGALGVLLSGYLADAYGVISVFWLTAGLALVAALSSLTLEKN
jgi:FSR family fosmidomycin resistance protein-like MFS transporter